METFIFRIAIVFTFVIGLFMSGCSEQAPLDSEANEAELSTLNKKGGDEDEDDDDDDSEYPQTASRTLNYINGDQGYAGGNVNVPGGSTFHLQEGSLTPPASIPVGDPVTITMKIKMDANETRMHFNFKPDGCEFNPPAEIWFDWSDLDEENGLLYLINEDGNYIPLGPDEIDTQGNRLKILIDHFSRYVITKG